MERLSIASVMTPDPVTVPADATLKQARLLMYRERIHHLPVIHNREVVGMLTDRDLNLIAYLANDFLSETALQASEACVPPFTVEVDEPLDAVLQAMAARRIGSALVLERGRLVGIFTAHDACSKLAQLLGTGELEPADRVARFADFL